MQYLPQILKLRAEIKEREMALKQLMPDAELEAMQIRDTEEAVNGKAIVHAGESGKIVLSYRKRYDFDAPVCQRLSEEIFGYQKKLARKHATEIEAIDRQIEQLANEIEALQEKREALVNSRQIERLQRRYSIALEKTVHFQPILSVYLDEEED